jgi:hypothetical protein
VAPLRGKLVRALGAGPDKVKVEAFEVGHTELLSAAPA